LQTLLRRDAATEVLAHQLMQISTQREREREREMMPAIAAITRATSLGKGTVCPGVSCSLTMCRGVVENCETKGFRSYGSADGTKLGFSGVEYSVSKGR
jgi:hypothetical protein